MRFAQISIVFLTLMFLAVSYADASGYTTRAKKNADAEETRSGNTEEELKQELCTKDDLAAIKALEKDIGAKEKEIREFGKKAEAGQVPRTRKMQKQFTKFSQEMTALQGVKNSDEMQATYKRCDMQETLPKAFWMPDHLAPPKQ